MPEEIFFDSIELNFQQKLLHAVIISDFSKQSYNDYFAKNTNENNQLLKITLLNFLDQRLIFSCIQAYLTHFMVDNSFEENPILNLEKSIMPIKISENSDFNFDVFKQNYIFQLIK